MTLTTNGKEALKTNGKEARGNHLLAALPSQAYDRLSPHLEKITFGLGEVVYESGAHMQYVYFPTTSHISLLYTMIDGSTAEMGLVGKEGVVGIALFMGGETAPNRAMVQGGGVAFRMKSKAMLDEFKRGGEFQQLLLRYTQALITQISQTAVCNRLHSVEQHLCRWLLMTHDLAQSDELQMTHEFISNILGVRREGVTMAARRLRDMKMISYVRGHITIVSRRQLLAHVCECYQVVKDEHSRLLG
ncbi:MAG TPA: Crp/Fnr family transcriptional regulator [Pyrinomonadaceae bacterium]|nr:Crp/Fnr family transcriptional regulator [Pyrinomonadaceae bacterium]